MAAPDGADGSDPGDRADRHLRAAELLVSRRLRSARLRLQRQRRAATRLARGAVLRHRRAQHQGRLPAATFTEVHNGRVPNHTQLRYTFNANAPATAPCTVAGGTRLCPISVSYFLSPRWDQHDRTQTIGLYAQDQWTIGRLTLQGGVRYDRAWSWAPAEGNGTTETSRFNPQPITFERTVSVRGYNDITPRFGVAYDLFGTGKTALKVNGGKYLEAATVDVIYSSNNPAARIITRIGSGPARGARLDRRQPQLRRRLRPAESGGAGQPGHRRRPVRGGRRRRPELRQRQPEHHDHQPGHSRRLGRASVRLAVRRVGAARARAAACRSRWATTAAGGATSSSPTTC